MSPTPPQDPPPEGVRLQKFLARAGVASRRKAEALMAQGRVRVNGVRAVTPGLRIDPRRDRVEVDGRPVSIGSTRWILLNKPRGVLTTRSDPGGGRTVYDVLPDEAADLRYLGRLDRDTEGLIIFTNDGDAGHALLHPSSGVPREYRALVKGVPAGATLRRLERGVDLDDGPARADSARLVRVLGGRDAVVGLVLKEGRKREVRRMMEAVGHPVRRLRRIGFGPQGLGDLRPGEWRKLDASEVRALHRAAGLDRRRR